MKKTHKNLLLTVIITLIIFGNFLLYLKFYTPNNVDSNLLRLKIMLFDENPLSVKVEDGLDANAMKVTWQSESGKETVIWNDGEKVNAIGNDYGKQTFKVYYQDLLLGEVHQFKTNNWHTHIYKSRVYYLSDTDIVVFDFSAEGPDQVTEENVNSKQ